MNARSRRSQCRLRSQSPPVAGPSTGYKTVFPSSDPQISGARGSSNSSRHVIVGFFVWMAMSHPLCLADDQWNLPRRDEYCLSPNLFFDQAEFSFRDLEADVFWGGTTRRQ